MINLNAGYIVFLTMVGQYLLYETFHFCCHVPENAFVSRIQERADTASTTTTTTTPGGATTTTTTTTRPQ